MKKIFASVILIIMYMCTACGASGNEFFKDASPENSALTMYCYDGENNNIGWIFDESQIKEILEGFAETDADEADDWSIDKVKAPIYSLDITAADGSPISIAWTNGYLIDDEGNAYTFDYDFNKLKDSYTWESEEVVETGSILLIPCARYLVLGENGWNSEFLAEDQWDGAIDNISMTLTEQTDNNLTVEISNNGTEDWIYGEFFVLEAEIDGKWYEIPSLPGNWVFNSIANVLMAGQTRTEDYNLDMYGELPAGRYRIVVDGLTAEFDIQ